MIKRFIVFTPILFLSKAKPYAYQIVRLKLKMIKWLIRPVTLRIRNYLVDVLTQALQLHQTQLQSQIDRIERYSLKASRQFAINYDHETTIIRTELGFIAFASDVPILGLLLEDDLETGTRRFIQKYLKPGNVFVDVGANMGIHTLAAASVMQNQGKIYAFEPLEETARLLKKTALFNTHLDIIEIHTAAVSNRTGYQKLFLAKTSGLHSLFPLTGAYAEDVPPIEVPVVKLDDVLNNITVDLIKIDAEGSEVNILEGAQSIIRKNLDIGLIVEFFPPHLARAGHTVKSWLAHFQELGLHCRVVNWTTGTLEEISQAQLEALTGTVNLFFARPNSRAWHKADLG